MADIIRQKKTGNGDAKTEEMKEERKNDDIVVSADVIVPSLINTLVSGQLGKLTKKSDLIKADETPKEKKRKHSRSPKRRRSRSKSRER